MVTKGLDFERVSVVGILNASAMLNQPDFRSYEHAFQMLEQVAGRAGRKDEQGYVVLQTQDVEASAIKQVVQHDYSAMYKEQMQLGFSKMLPQIALGQSQSSILATAYFENDILDLINVFIPPLMSSTMNGDILTRKQNINGGDKSGNGNGNTDKEGGGRPTNQDSGKPTSEKTIKNQESKGNG